MQNYFCIEAETALPSTTPPYPTKLYPPPQSRTFSHYSQTMWARRKMWSGMRTKWWNCQRHDWLTQNCMQWIALICTWRLDHFAYEESSQKWYWSFCDLTLHNLKTLGLKHSNSMTHFFKKSLRMTKWWRSLCNS